MANWLGIAISHESHHARERGERQEGQPGNNPQDHHQEGRHEEGGRVIAELSQNGLFRRTAGAALGDEQARGQRDDQRGNLRDETVPDRQLGVDVARRRQPQPMPGDADHDAAEDVDAQDDQARDRVAAHELGGAVHRSEECALFLEFAAAQLRRLVVDQAGRQIGVDGHLLAGNRVESETGADFGDTRGALGDDEKVDRHENQKDDDADDEVAAHHKAREAGDDVAGRGGSLSAMR